MTLSIYIYLLTFVLTHEEMRSMISDDEREHLERERITIQFQILMAGKIDCYLLTKAN